MTKFTQEVRESLYAYAHMLAVVIKVPQSDVVVEAALRLLVEYEEELDLLGEQEK